MDVWNYVVTAQKPTSVTHSCTGNFTGLQDRNIIIAKYACIEIHLRTADGTKLMLAVPTHGRIEALELFRPNSTSQDLLLLVTESCRFCILQWDGAASVLITRANGNLLNGRPCPTGKRQIVIVNPDCRLIGLYQSGGLFKVIPFDEGWKPKKAFKLRLEKLHVLDIKFLYSCSEPTIVILYQNCNDTCYVKTYVVAVKTKDFIEGPWSLCDICNSSGLLIPVSMPPGGAIIIGQKTIIYHNGTILKTVAFRTSIIRAYARVDADGSRYLLSDCEGHLYLLTIQHKQNGSSGLEIEGLGTTFVLSTISWVDKTIVYIGSSCGDSQLIELAVDPHGLHSKFKVLVTYDNLGPIQEFYVVDPQRRSQGQVITLSGAYRDCLRTIVFSRGFNEMASLKFPRSIRDIWSLQVSAKNGRDTLVVELPYVTQFLQMDPKRGLVDTYIGGFDDSSPTLFCGNASDDLLVQVTSKSVRLVSSTSGELWDTWTPPFRDSITVATGDAFQVLLAIGENYLVSIYIWDEYLEKSSHTELEDKISCIEMYQTRSSTLVSLMAAVGTSTGSVTLYHIPGLFKHSTVKLDEEIIPRSILLCELEGVSYLFCSLKDGHLSYYVGIWEKNMTHVRTVPLGTKRFTLRRFFSEGISKVFAASDRPTVISSRSKELFYTDLNMEEASDMCPFNSAAFPDRLAVVKERELSIGTIIPKGDIRSIVVGKDVEHICQQKESRTFAICSYCLTSFKETDRFFIRLLDDHTFEIMSTYKLETDEYCFSLISCSFTNDNNVYYCVGTSNFSCSKGRILVFIVKDRTLQLVAVKETEGDLNELKAFDDKLLVGINFKIRVYKWTLQDDGSHELQPESGNHHNGQPWSNCNLVGDSELMKPNPVLLLEGKVRYYTKKRETAGKVPRDNNIIRDTGELGFPGLLGEYLLGELVNRFQDGPLIKPFLDSKASSVPTLIFGTDTGMIGVIASIPPFQHDLLKKLQSYLTNLRTGVGGLSHKEWQCFTRKNTEFENAFLDGDLIESFLNLDRRSMIGISKEIGYPVEEVHSLVQEMSSLH